MLEVIESEVDITQILSYQFTILIIAGSCVSSLEHLEDVFNIADADAAMGAIFFTIRSLVFRN